MTFKDKLAEGLHTLSGLFAATTVTPTSLEAWEHSKTGSTHLATENVGAEASSNSQPPSKQSYRPSWTEMLNFFLIAVGSIVGNVTLLVSPAAPVVPPAEVLIWASVSGVIVAASCYTWLSSWLASRSVSGLALLLAPFAGGFFVTLGGFKTVMAIIGIPSGD